METFSIPRYINKPFQNLPLKKRACLILVMAGFTLRQIEKFSGTPLATISRYVSEGCEEYNIDNGTNAPISERDIKISYVGGSNELDGIQGVNIEKKHGTHKRSRRENSETDI